MAKSEVNVHGYRRVTEVSVYTTRSGDTAISTYTEDGHMHTLYLSPREAATVSNKLLNRTTNPYSPTSSTVITG